MAVPYTGIGTFLGFGKESTWGTAVSRTNWSRATDAGVSLRKQQIVLPVPELSHGTNGDIRNTYLSREETTGGFEVLARYDGIGLLLEALLGGTPTTSGASSPYTHTFGLGTALPGLTVEVVRGSSGVSEVFEGFTVGSWTLSGAAGEPVRLSVEGIAQTSAASRASAGTPAESSTELIVCHQATTTTFNGSSYTLQSFEITGNNNISDLLEIGNLETSEPPISNFREIRGSVTFAMRSDALWTAHQTGTTGDLVLTFTGSSPNAITITLQNCVIDDYDDTIGGPGVITATANFLARAASGADSIEVQVVNGSSSATANGN
jgi:hypothetical protein